PDLDDEVATLEATHGTGDELALAVLELVVDVVALGLAHALDDHLLGRLRRDAPEGLDGVVQVQQIPVLLLLLAGAIRVLGAVEDLEQQLVTELGLETMLLGIGHGDLAALLGGRRALALDDVANLEEVDRADLFVVLRLELAVHAEDLLR